MKRYFITAKHDTPLFDLVKAHLPPGVNADAVISSGGIWKNKKRILDKQFIIGSGETVKVHLSEFQGKYYHVSEKQVVFENDDLLVVYKPPDLNVHAVPTTIHYHLSYGVDQYLKSRGIHYESTPIMRLDRAVEGLVLFAKNKNSERILFDRVKRRKVHKWYMAAVEKPAEPAPHRLRVRDNISNKGMRTSLDPEGKPADSLFIKTGEDENVCIYSVFIFTGRRHQIRFHASHYIAPIIGDSFYGSSVVMPPDEIALMCRGYNIPYKKKILRIRVPDHYLEQFYRKIKKK